MDSIIRKNIRSTLIKEYFDMKLPEETKKLSNVYSGRAIVWFGDRERMVVVHKDQVHGMYGNIFDHEKLQWLKNVLKYSEEKIELECSYAMAERVDLSEIEEHQVAVHTDRFMIDYSHHEEPYSTDDDELDKYLGNEDYFDDEGYGPSSIELSQLLNSYKTKIGMGSAKISNFYDELESLKKLDDIIEEGDLKYVIPHFIEMEEKVKNAINNEWGDIGMIAIQLRDGHHRVIAAIESGEEYVCVNMAKDDFERFKDELTVVTQSYTGKQH